MLLFLVTASAQCAQIVLVYPRAVGAEESFIYPDELDSTFILGHIVPHEGQLRINGYPVDFTAHGAFLAWLPIEKRSDSQRWILELTIQGERVASLSFPYVFASEVAAPIPSDTLQSTAFPRIVRVIVPNAHTRTMIGGSYHIFPDVGCPLRAIGHRQNFFEIELGGGLTGVIEDRFVTILDESMLPSAILGNGWCDSDERYSHSVFSISRSVPWSANLSADGRSLKVMLYDTKAAIDRIQYDSSDDFLMGISWEQLPAGLALSWSCRAPISRGYEVSCRGGELRVGIGTAPLTKDRSLRGKWIILDPGHGGTQDGAIGPLGTREKDVNLEWARILTAVLRKAGAFVELTRDSDVELSLYDRIDFARERQTDFFISLHCNALPDGVNPYLRQGTGTYFYQMGSRRAAEIIHEQVLRETKLRDDGLWAANLAVVRPTNFPAVLIEAAYIIHPAEEELLRDNDFLQRLSRGVERGLRRYFREVSK